MILLSQDKLTSSQWLMPVIPATQETEIKRITVQSQLGQIVRSYLEKKPIKK
jgi:hypothetical protein